MMHKRNTVLLCRHLGCPTEPRTQVLQVGNAADAPNVDVAAGGSGVLPVVTALPPSAGVGAPVDAPSWEVAATAPPTLSQVVATMEAALSDLCALQAGRDPSGELASCWVAWEHDLQVHEVELRHRGEQVHLALIDIARQVEALATQE